MDQGVASKEKTGQSLIFDNPDVRGRAEDIATAVRSTLPGASVEVRHGGSAAGKSAYVAIRYRPEKSKRQIVTEFRVSDHSIGPSRYGDYAVHANVSEPTDLTVVLKKLSEAKVRVDASVSEPTNKAHGGPVYASELLHMQNGGDPFRRQPGYVDPAGGYQITDHGWLDEEQPPPEPVVPLGSNVPLTVLRNTPAGRAVRGLGALSRLLPPSVLKQISKGVNWLQKTPFNPLGLEEPPATTVERGIRALIRAPAPFATSDTPPSPAGVAALAPEAKDMTRPTPYEEDPTLDSTLQEARQPGTELQAKRSDIGLYSQLEDVVLKMPQPNFKTGEQAYNYLSKHVKDVEMQWSGLKDRLKGSNTKVTKQEILEHVRANEVKVIERRYDAPSFRQLEDEEKRLIGDLTVLQRLGSSYPGISETIASVRQALADNQNLRADMAAYPERYRAPKHPSQTLSGGTNPRDLLLQRVAGQSLSETDEARFQQLLSNKDQLSYSGIRHGQSQPIEEKLEMEALSMKSDKGKRLAYRDPHYKQVNTIAWIRLKDVLEEVDPRTGEPKPMLFTAVETPDFRDRVYYPVDATTRALELSGDLQSDHAQKGAKEGFLGPEILVEGKNKEHWLGLERRFREDAEKTLQDRGLTPDNPDHMWYTKLREALEENSGHQNAATNLNEIRRIEAEQPRESSGAVLDTPFKREEHWAGLMLKHMLREAANPPQGQKYDMLTWTPGEIQVQRMMGGRRFAETIVYRQPTGEDGAGLNQQFDRGQLEVYDKRGKELINSKYATRKSIERHLGKSVAERLLAQKPEIWYPKDIKTSVYTLDAETDPGAVDMGTSPMALPAPGIPFGNYQKNLRFYDQTIGNTFRQILKPLIGKEAAKKAIGHVWRRIDDNTINKLARDPVTLQSGVVDVEKGLLRMHSLNLTPELLEKVRAGLTKFAGGGPIFKAQGGLASMAPEARAMFGKPRSMGKEPRPTALSPGTNPGVAGLCGVARNMNRSVVA
jgi:hypothetical protein